MKLTIDDEIAEYYQRHLEDARRLSVELAEARARGAAPQEIRRLERALEQARYVGD